ncbi:MAG: hypothetical protein V7K32_19060 [Nostoc sp.]
MSFDLKVSKSEYLRSQALADAKPPSALGRNPHLEEGWHRARMYYS